MTAPELGTVRLAIRYLESGDSAAALTALRSLTPTGAADARDLWLLSLPASAPPSREWPYGRSYKIDAIKAIRYNTTLGLVEAKAVVESLPYCLGRYDADSTLARDLLALGAAVEWR